MKISHKDLILSIESRVPAYYVSLTGQAKFYTLCSMLLETAASQARQFHFGYDDMIRDNIYWVLSRLHVRMKAYPVMDQPVRIETWPKGIHKLFYLRDYRMYSAGGKVLAEATTAWIVLDLKTGRPRKTDGNGRFEYFRVEDRHGIEEVPSKLPPVSEPGETAEHAVVYSDLDINRHVNAVKYIEWIQDHYPATFYEDRNIRELQINFLSETRFGETVEIRMKRAGEREGFDHFEGIRKKDRSVAFRSKLLFGIFT